MYNINIFKINCFYKNMKVILAGYNVDAELLEEIKKGNKVNSESLTPETISAAYARISRSQKSVDELRKISRQEVEEARKSNRSIIFGMGHHSVADHAIFNIDIIDVSRLLVESIEERRLAGYTEKSQRYVTFDGDYIKPVEYDEKDIKKLEDLIKLQNDFYLEASQKLFYYLKDKNSKELNKLNENSQKEFIKKLENLAKEDARYSLSLATKTQLGNSYTGQTAELAIRRLKYGRLEEEKESSKLLYNSLVKVAPSLIQLTDLELFKKYNPDQELKDDNFKYTKKHLEELVNKTFLENEYKKYHIENLIGTTPTANHVTLINSNNTDLNIISALLFKNSKKSIINCYSLANHLIQNNKAIPFIKESLKYISEYDKLPREFETSGLIYEIILSSSCFAQLKRHRINTLLSQDYNPELGITIPLSIMEVNMDNKLIQVCNRSGDLYYDFLLKYEKAAEYALTNAHRRRVLLATNLRQFYHISRTREDKHAQWEIRNIAQTMSELTKKIAPVTTILLGGKDKFEEIKKEIYK